MKKKLSLAIVKMRISAVTIAACLGNHAVFADELPGPVSQSPTVVAEIVVTAQKRAEYLQNVPLSVAAFSSETLAESEVQDFASMAARIPGVALNSAGPGRSSYAIRGIASIGGNAPTTGVYLDETPIVPSGGDGATATTARRAGRGCSRTGRARSGCQCKCTSEPVRASRVANRSDRPTECDCRLAGKSL